MRRTGNNDKETVMNLPYPLEAHGTAITAGILNTSEYPLAYVVKIFPEEIARGYAADIVRACNTHNRFVGLSRIILARLDLEANEDNPIFPCAAFREDLRKVLQEATA